DSKKSGGGGFDPSNGDFGDAGQGKHEFTTIQQTFDNGTQGHSEYKLMLNSDLFKQEIKLVEKTGNMSLQFNQVNRPTQSDLFKQGSGGQNKTDAFKQEVGTGLLDILIVMDNSGSM